MSSEADPERDPPESKFAVGQEVLVPGVVEDVYWGGRTSAPKVRVSVTVTKFSTIVYDESEVVARGTTARAPHPGAMNAWFCSLPEGRQAVLREDKWMLAQAAWDAALSPQPAPPNSAQGDSSESDSEKPEAVGGSPLGREADWALAMGHALGLDSGYRVPIVPSVDAFKELFSAVRASGYADGLAEAHRWSPPSPAASGLSANSRADKPSEPSGDHHE